GPLDGAAPAALLLSVDGIRSTRLSPTKRVESDAMAEATAPAEKLEFRTELKQLLHIITHSLYSHPEIFLRELISNASDAINKVKFDSLAHEGLLEGNKDWKIKIVPDRDR